MGHGLRNDEIADRHSGDEFWQRQGASVQARFFFFKQKTAYAMRISDWSQTCALPISASQRRKVVALVSKFDHCLGHLLYAGRIGEIDMDVVAIISNHPKEALTIKSWLEDVPYHYFPITKDTKAEQEARIKATKIGST